MTLKADRIFNGITRASVISLIGIILLMGLMLFYKALPSLSEFGFDFFWKSNWDPVAEQFGIWPIIYGTLVSSFVAVLMAAPLGIGVAIFLSELSPPRLTGILGMLVEWLAAIPSVIYGLWGIFCLVPFLRGNIEPFLARWFGFLPFFSGPTYGIGMLAAGIILAIMILPIISSITRDVLKAVPLDQREAALALGATKWETTRLAVLRYGRSGILGAIFLGLGRALGETMAVTMVIGNRAEVSLSLFAPGQTMASVIANEFSEATGGLHIASLIEIGLALFLMTFVINSLARLLVWRVSRIS